MNEPNAGVPRLGCVLGRGSGYNLPAPLVAARHEFTYCKDVAAGAVIAGANESERGDAACRRIGNATLDWALKTKVEGQQDFAYGNFTYTPSGAPFIVESCPRIGRQAAPEYHGGTLAGFRAFLARSDLPHTRRRAQTTGRCDKWCNVHTCHHMACVGCSFTGRPRPRPRTPRSRPSALLALTCSDRGAPPLADQTRVRARAPARAGAARGRAPRATASATPSASAPGVAPKFRAAPATSSTRSFRRPCRRRLTSCPGSSISCSRGAMRCARQTRLHLRLLLSPPP